MQAVKHAANGLSVDRFGGRHLRERWAVQPFGEVEVWFEHSDESRREARVAPGAQGGKLTPSTLG